LRVDSRIRKAYAGIVSPEDIQTMLIAENNGTKYGIMLRARPDDKQRANIVRYMEIALQAGQIEISDAMYFMERIESGADISEIRQEIAYSIQKKQEQEQANQQQNIAAQNDGLAKIEEMKAQNQAKQTVLDTQSKIAEENERAKSKARLSRMEANYRLIEKTQEQADAEKGLIIAKPSR
jgi:predicted ATP-dependent endonuclease of OLD family